MGKALVAERPRYVVELPPPPPKDYKFSCIDCDKKFAKLSRLTMHQAIHLSEKPYKCSFEGCESSYYRKTHLQRHEATKHTTMGGGFKCSFDGCLASFDSATSLYFHNKKKHCEKKFSCPICREMFSKKYQLKEHTFEHAGHTTPLFKCGVQGCNEEFRLHALLKSHQKLHRKRRIAGEEESQNRKTYQCSECNEVFEKWSSCLAHKKSAHCNLMECPTCKKKFSHSHIRNHIKIHAEQRDIFPCPYETCSKSYQHSQNLANHIGTFHKGRSFVCGICSKQLSTKQKLNHHINIIHESAPKAVQDTNDDFMLSRSKLLDMLSGETDFEISRRGPAKGVHFPTNSDGNSGTKVTTVPSESLVISGTNDLSNSLLENSNYLGEEYLKA
ncbi:zinc finger protein 84 isoform X2 [Folsomia candida]|uniref:Transcription factor IIIA n=1 Tax=Folsomia candida TaxID=158441 RepID=A0A226E3R7_FOLCA|nr:zinc finger protein 84 isoform X2 [Folsomia candida]OXA51918.1 Transcription factor IIIA [Folsomia candida]